MAKKTYISWFEVFGIGIILLVGGTYWTRTEDNHILGYMLLFGISYLLFLLLLDEKKLRKKFERDLQKTSENYIEVADLISSEIGCRYNLYMSESNIGAKGSAEVVRTVELEAIKGIVASVDYRSLSATATIRDYEVEVLKILGTSDVSSEILERTPTTTRFLLKFSPPLKEREIIRYEIREKYGEGRHPMTLEKILDRIKDGKWLSDEPYDYKAALIKYPVIQLVSTVILPKEYKITTAEHFFDVKVGFYGGSRHFEEYERVRREKCFSKEIIGDKQVLRLVVNNPKVGLEYAIKWKPPYEKKYKEFLASLERQEQ